MLDSSRQARMTKKKKSSIKHQLAIPPQLIERRIYLIRGLKVMLSTHLAELYDVEPRTLMQAVKRKAERFPPDFMFRLSREEFSAVRSQIVILQEGRGRHPKYPPYAFSEQGVAMLSSVLNSKRAVQVNIAIMRAFVRLRRILSTNKALARKVQALERGHTEHDAKINAIFDAIRELMKPPDKPKPRIGFKGDKT